MTGFRRLKPQVLALLTGPDWEEKLASLLDIPPQKIIAPLFSLLLHPPEIKWHAVTAFGLVVPSMAEQDMKGALAVMRRFLWHMQRNSSNSGWGISESLGEVMAQSERLAKRFHKQLISYIQNPRCLGSGNNYIEYPQLRQMAYWGLGRLSEARPEFTVKAVPDLLQALPREGDASKGLICWALGSLRVKEAQGALEPLAHSKKNVEIYRHRKLTKVPLGALAQEALRTIQTQQGPESLQKDHTAGQNSDKRH
ncbi:MAG: HEAT repeat domain-containing protein [Thermodesulfobacteriota bacterium]|nr:HEAT repeat domain-containing protein [Thermodesulfobacteriota bacterium]